jgi:hypothetical protein
MCLIYDGWLALPLAVRKRLALTSDQQLKLRIA